ncbi:TNF receptor-associated factor 6-like [Alosa pseudoharengus]|uniref:TNF receptor-associated factor 6-like n=1 Tax=Alosa pseudoharengus TaxID=34774 RepID=UPI003F89BB4F
MGEQCCSKPPIKNCGDDEGFEMGLPVREKLKHSIRSTDTLDLVSQADSGVMHTPLPQGYDAEFDPPLEKKYECPICLMALRTAVQTPCGHRFCRGCIERSIREAGSKCPIDNEVLTLDQLFSDNFANREILSLTVACCNSECHQKMELRYIESHLVQCQFSTEPCPLCQAALLKNQLDEHTVQHCPRRSVPCPACMEMYIWDEKQLHEGLCPFASVVCEFCSGELIRDHLASHCDTDCPEAPVTCTFSSFGCEEKMSRSSLAQHMQEFTHLHLSSMAAFLKRQNLFGEPSMGAAARSSAVTSEMDTSLKSSVDHLELQQMRETVQQLDGRLVRQVHLLRELSIQVHSQATQLQDLHRHTAALDDAVQGLKAVPCNGAFTWRVEGFQEHLENHRANRPVVLYSPGFYTGRPGYRLCLRLQLQPPTAPHNPSFLSLFVHTMRGAFDNQVAWPLQGTLKLIILDPVEGLHMTEVMETKPDLLAFQRPTAERNQKGFGYVTFVHLSKLSKRYMEDDILQVRCEATLKL